jgi:hypothetical protein
MLNYPITVTLKKPVEHNKTRFDEIVFKREVIGLDLVAMDAVQGETRKNYALYASLAGVPIQVIYNMNGSDIRKVAEAAAPVLGEYLGLPALDEQAKSQPTA